MPNIYSTGGDGWAMTGAESSWVNARRSAGVSSDNNNSRDSMAVLVEYLAGKGGGLQVVMRRAFMSFNTSGISVAPSEATLKVRGYANQTADVIVVKSTAATTVVAGSFDDIPNTATPFGATDGSGAGTLAGVSGLTYSAEIATWSVSGYVDIELNSTALDDMASLDTFKICIMEYDSDYLDITPSLNSFVKIGFYWAENTGTSLDPYIDYTAGVASVAHNAPFFGTNF
jgi:hypothetical protein